MSVMALLMAALVPLPARGVMTFDTGAGKEYKLRVTQDVTLERGSVNFNSLEYLIVSKHPGYPNKRSLVQFEDLPRSCPSSNILSAKMHLYYEYSTKQVVVLSKLFLLFHAICECTWLKNHGTNLKRPVPCASVASLGLLRG